MYLLFRICKSEKRNLCKFCCCTSNYKTWPQCVTKSLVKMKKALHLRMEDMNIKYVSKAVSYMKTLARDPLKSVRPSHLPQVRDCYISKTFKCGLKNKKIIGEVTTTNEEVVATPPAELKMLIKEKGYYPHQVFNYEEIRLFWKKIPYRTCIHNSTKEAVGHKHME